MLSMSSSAATIVDERIDLKASIVCAVYLKLVHIAKKGGTPSSCGHVLLSSPPKPSKRAGLLPSGGNVPYVLNTPPPVSMPHMSKTVVLGSGGGALGDKDGGGDTDEGDDGDDDAPVMTTLLVPTRILT